MRDPDTPSHYMMKILNAFRRTSVPGMTEYEFYMPGFRNPILTSPTFSFEFYTYDV